MKRTAVDTNVIVAALASWHERHEQARDALNVLLQASKLVLPAHCVVETYSVLTRLPAPHRVACNDAASALTNTFGKQRLAAWGVAGLWSSLADWANAGVGGGRIYDALIARAAKKGGAEQLLTLNVKHMQAVAQGISVIGLEDFFPV